jgi:hypothetical protein
MKVEKSKSSRVIIVKKNQNISLILINIAKKENINIKKIELKKPDEVNKTMFS